MKIKFFVAFSGVLWVLTASTSGIAQVPVPISAGCAEINAVSDLSSGGSFINDFLAYERIVLTADLPDSGTPTGITLSVDSTEVDSDGFPGEVSYQILVDGSAEILYRSEGGSVTWEGTCAPGKPPSNSIPALSWQGITVLVTLLTGFAYYRRRKAII